jgi:hypothetical protein
MLSRSFRLTGFDDVLGPADRVCRVGRDHLPCDEPVEQHADRGQVLFDRRLLEILAERLDIGRDVQRLDIGELAELVVLAPGKEAARSMQIGGPGVLIADGRAEEFQIAARGVLAGVGDHRRDDDMCGDSRDGPVDSADGQLAARLISILRHGFSVT